MKMLILFGANAHSFCQAATPRPYKSSRIPAKDNRTFNYYIRKQFSSICAREEDERYLIPLAAFPVASQSRHSPLI
jgi:hypothetical protein